MTMTRRSRLCLIAAVILRDWGTMDVVGFVVVGEGRGGVWLTTSAVMSASARRESGEREVEQEQVPVLAAWMAAGHPSMLRKSGASSSLWRMCQRSVWMIE